MIVIPVSLHFVEIQCQHYLAEDLSFPIKLRRDGNFPLNYRQRNPQIRPERTESIR